jgi:hypothetical protein
MSPGPNNVVAIRGPALTTATNAAIAMASPLRCGQNVYRRAKPITCHITNPIKTKRITGLLMKGTKYRGDKSIGADHQKNLKGGPDHLVGLDSVRSSLPEATSQRYMLPPSPPARVLLSGLKANDET